MLQAVQFNIVDLFPPAGNQKGFMHNNSSLGIIISITQDVISFIFLNSLNLLVKIYA